MNPEVIAALVAAAGAFGFAVWVYRRRELPIQGRERLSVLRGATFTLVVLLLLDPRLPFSGGERHRLLIDDSPSMGATLAAGGSAEDSTPSASTEGSEATTEAFGVADEGRIVPAVARAIESGVTRVTVVTDGRLPDGVELRSLLQRAPVDFELQDVGGPVRNAGVESIRLPRDVAAGADVVLPVTIFWEGGDAPLQVELRGDDGVLATETIEPTSTRGRAEAQLRFTAPDVSGDHVIHAAVRSEDDGFAGDDRKGAVLQVDPDRGAVVLVSGAAAWEARYLALTLAEVSGLPVIGFLRAGDDGRFLRTGEAPELVERESVLRAVEDAALVVRHAGAELDSALVAAVDAVERRILLDPRASAGTRPSAAGEWYLTAELPASPLAAELAGIPLLGLPPLALPPTEVATSAADGVPLALQRDGSGDARPALLLREIDGDRVAEVWAEGWWRWALRPGEGSTIYRRLWSGVAGWLLAGDPADLRTGIAPRVAVDRPDVEIEWDAAPAAGGRLEVLWFDGSADSDTEPTRTDTLQVSEIGRARAPGLPEGSWSWRATVLDGEAEGRERSGRLLRESWSGDLALPRDESLSELTATAPAARTAGRPLRGSAWPWIALVLLLSAEWFVRRRIGLR